MSSKRSRSWASNSPAIRIDVACWRNSPRQVADADPVAGVRSPRHSGVAAGREAGPRRICRRRRTEVGGRFRHALAAEGLRRLACRPHRRRGPAPQLPRTRPSRSRAPRVQQLAARERIVGRALDQRGEARGGLLVALEVEQRVGRGCALPRHSRVACEHARRGRQRLVVAVELAQGDGRGRCVPGVVGFDCQRRAGSSPPPRRGASGRAA